MSTNPSSTSYTVLGTTTTIDLTAFLQLSAALPSVTLKPIGKSWVANLTGTSGNDVFDPGTGIGSSTMAGGTGNDTYYVHSGNDKVVEKAGEGTDTVISDISYTLGD